MFFQNPDITHNIIFFNSSRGYTGLPTPNERVHNIVIMFVYNHAGERSRLYRQSFNLSSWPHKCTRPFRSSLVRPLFFYFLVYGFLGWKNGSVGRKKKKKKFQITIM